ncbi:stage III sporulation protein AG [Bacillus ginsengihumi]|uniref:Stage III sporulation protein AG n=1 Tax=Heyndrickxia ginsengihumi TaxID=363870 RepID=A0A6M0P5S8_9BACI|nr:stage III sporulation protein AG [Heyndrickxia ginsengihumi]MBE6182970.1 stage III sporulation protein AG [Bacillus sp. (in: firmicutes)]NEY20074.1 stage III sporulation protein AG [Heyndrickxia ginsengihumi]
MNNKHGPLDQLKEWLSIKPSSSNKKNKKYPIILLLFICGISVMVLNNLFSHHQSKNNLTAAAMSDQSSKSQETISLNKNSSSKKKSINSYQEQYQEELKQILEQMSGVGSVKVLVNVASTESKVYEKNSTVQNQITTETDKNGGERKIDNISKDDKVVTVQDGEKQVPLVTETKKPKITGVLVVCQGGNDIAIQRAVKEAVSNALDVPSYRVSVMSKK